MAHGGETSPGGARSFSPPPVFQSEGEALALCADDVAALSRPPWPRCPPRLSPQQPRHGFWPDGGMLAYRAQGGGADLALPAGYGPDPFQVGMAPPSAEAPAAAAAAAGESEGTGSFLDGGMHLAGGHRGGNWQRDTQAWPSSDGLGADSLLDLEKLTLGGLLPSDEDDLLAGLGMAPASASTDRRHGLPPGQPPGPQPTLAAQARQAPPHRLASSLDDGEEFDVFSGGGMELEGDNGGGGGSGVDSSGREYWDHGRRLMEVSAAGPMGADGSGIGNGSSGVTAGGVAGEHPYGEHPSRTLFVRNINSNVEDSELRSVFEARHSILSAAGSRSSCSLAGSAEQPAHLLLVALGSRRPQQWLGPGGGMRAPDRGRPSRLLRRVQQYGTIRTLYTACKHRGFVMISYYDIRAARNAMRALQNKPLRRRKLDIHFSIPKENPTDKDVNQGTLVVFNLDASVSNDDLLQIFGAHGEVKEIRETPNRRHHKFVEYYDVRCAEAALRALNRSDIAGKRIKLEPSRPGGTWRSSLIQHLGSDPEAEDSLNGGGATVLPRLMHGGDGSSPASLPSAWSLHQAFSAPGMVVAAADQARPLHHVHSSPVSLTSLYKTYSGFYNGGAGLPPHPMSPARMSSSSVGLMAGYLRDLEGGGAGPAELGQHSLGSVQRLVAAYQPHSLPEYHSTLAHATNTADRASPLGAYSTAAAVAAVGSVRGAPLELKDGGSGDTAYARSLLLAQSNHSHSRLDSQLDRRYSFLADYSEAGSRPSSLSSLSSSMHGGSSGISSMDSGYSDSTRHSGSLVSNSGSNAASGSGSDRSRGLSSFAPKLMVGSLDSGGGGSGGAYSPTGRSRVAGFSSAGLLDGLGDRGRTLPRRMESLNFVEGKKQFQLDIERILAGEDLRTTLMIKNIPNKYTQKMLLATIDEFHRGSYDFFYLPIDFKNKCNVGYAFINMITPLKIAFNGKKWEKFNSEKVASLAYARIQGKAALVSHFQNSSLMNEDKRCRPILFHSEGPQAGDQEPFPMGLNVRSRPGRERSSSYPGSSQYGSSPANSSSSQENSHHGGTYFSPATLMSSSYMATKEDPFLGAESYSLASGYLQGKEDTLHLGTSSVSFFGNPYMRGPSSLSVEARE
eukprot:SM000164S02265  [mRNA]  locus=s164:118569:123747:- [translate_table: standard]